MNAAITDAGIRVTVMCLGRLVPQCALEDDELPGMIEVMLGNPNELCVRAVRRLRDEWSIEAIGVEAKNCVPYLVV